MSETEKPENILFSRNVIEFVTVAVEYCNFIEQNNKVSAFEFSAALLKILPLTYLKACIITNIETESESVNEDFVTEEIYNYIQETISAKLAENDLDCDVPETSSQNGENTTAKISEILTDIYQDLKNFTMNYRTNNEFVMANSLYAYKINFEQYWGERLISALSAFHKLIYGNTDWESTKINKSSKEADTSNWLISQRQQEWENEF